MTVTCVIQFFAEGVRPLVITFIEISLSQLYVIGSVQTWSVCYAMSLRDWTKIH